MPQIARICTDFLHRLIFFINSHKENRLWRLPICENLIRRNEKILLAIQVCWHLTTDNLEREIQGLKNAMTETKAKTGVIITLNQEDEFDGIKAIPALKWMENQIEI